jgi:hypothetical protein
VIDVIDASGALDGEIEGLRAARDAVEEVAHVLAGERGAVIAREGAFEILRLVVGGGVDGAEVVAAEAPVEEGADARGDGEQRLAWGAARGRAVLLDPFGEALAALGDVGVGEDGGAQRRDALGDQPEDVQLVLTRLGLLLLPPPFAATDAGLLGDGAREVRAVDAAKRPDGQRQELEDAVWIARRVGKLEGEREDLHRGPPGGSGRMPLMR